MVGVVGFNLENNIDLVGLKEFLNNWLSKRNLDFKYGKIESSLESEFFKPYTDNYNKQFPLYYENTQYIEWLDGVYSRLALERSNDQGIFYWFKPYDRAVEILKEEKLHLLSLDKQDLNDHAEALEFTQRYEFFPYSQHYHNSSYTKEDFPHIACFTKDFRSQKFWDEYALNETGVALGIRIIFKGNETFGDLKPFMLRDVFYDTGYDLDFLNELRYQTFKKFNVIISTVPNKLKWMQYHYKRDKYRWENETRLSFNIMDYLRLFSVDSIRADERLILDGIESNLGDDTYSKFLTKVPFINPYFEVQLNEIICGKNFSDAQMEELKEITQSKILIWRR